MFDAWYIFVRYLLISSVQGFQRAFKSWMCFLHSFSTGVWLMSTLIRLPSDCWSYSSSRSINFSFYFWVKHNEISNRDKRMELRTWYGYSSSSTTYMPFSTCLTRSSTAGRSISFSISAVESSLACCSCCRFHFILLRSHSFDSFAAGAVRISGWYVMVFCSYSPNDLEGPSVVAENNFFFFAPLVEKSIWEKICGGVFSPRRRSGVPVVSKRDLTQAPRRIRKRNHKIKSVVFEKPGK